MKRETKQKKEIIAATARELIQNINALGFKPADVAMKMKGGPSSRTIYRWLAGECCPQRESDVVMLAKVYKELKKSRDSK
jgi:ribosomal protein S28E/S33